MKNLLPASHCTIRTNRSRHLRPFILRTQILRRIAHRLAAGPVSALKNLPHHRPLHHQIFNHSNLRNPSSPRQDSSPEVRMQLHPLWICIFFESNEDSGNALDPNSAIAIASFQNFTSSARRSPEPNSPAPETISSNLAGCYTRPKSTARQPA